ncbi:MAG: STAS domain-containing protein, partial [Gammaproteobacteria bacterium]|nr:STAS domain-containing protein [Gammaproteobacteria bacterium]
SVIGADIKDHEIVVFDFSDARYLDDSAAMVIEQLLDVAREADTSVIVVGLSGTVAEMINTLGVLRAVPKDHVGDDLPQARRIARRILED